MRGKLIGILTGLALLTAGIVIAVVVNDRSPRAASLATSTCVKGTGQHCGQQTTSTTTPTTAPTTTTVPTTTTTASGPDLPLNDAWTCTGTVAYGTVTVNVPANSSKDSVTLECSGVIDTLNVNGGPKDGIKVHGLAHDLSINGGYLTCVDHSPGSHQDGIQVMGAHDVTFRNFNSNCQHANNAGLFVNSAGGASGITNFRYIGGEVHGHNCGQVVTIGNSTDSGVSGTTIFDTIVLDSNQDQVFHRLNSGAVRPLTDATFVGCS